MKYVLAVIATFICWYLLAASLASFVEMTNKFDITTWDEFHRGVWLVLGIASSIGACAWIRLNDKDK